MPGPDVQPAPELLWLARFASTVRTDCCCRPIDHLFDEGYITFSTNQELVIVPELRDKLLDAWGIDAGVRVGEFSREQSAYLDYHRANVFKHSLLGGWL